MLIRDSGLLFWGHPVQPMQSITSFSTQDNKLVRNLKQLAVTIV